MHYCSHVNWSHLLGYCPNNRHCSLLDLIFTSGIKISLLVTMVVAFPHSMSMAHQIVSSNLPAVTNILKVSRFFWLDTTHATSSRFSGNRIGQELGKLYLDNVSILMASSLYPVV